VCRFSTSTSGQPNRLFISCLLFVIERRNWDLKQQACLYSISQINNYRLVAISQSACHVYRIRKSVKTVKRYSSPEQVIPELWGVTYLMGSHSVRPTCHPTQVNTPRLPPARQVGTRLTYPGGIEGWVDLSGCLVGYVPIRFTWQYRQLPIQVVTPGV